MLKMVAIKNNYYYKLCSPLIIMVLNCIFNWENWKMGVPVQNGENYFNPSLGDKSSYVDEEFLGGEKKNSSSNLFKKVSSSISSSMPSPFKKSKKNERDPFDGRQRHHEREGRNAALKLIFKVASKIKSVDGIDELCTVLAQILPGLAGPIASAAILSVASPFVWLGVLGMKEEYENALKEFNDILEEESESEKKLRDLAKFSKKYRKIVNQKCDLNILEEDDAGLINDLLDAKSFINADELAGRIVEYEKIQNEKFIAALGRKYGWTGLLGMSGMFAGMVIGTAASSVDIASQVVSSAVVSASLSTAATALTTATSGAFIVGQTAMIAYSINRVRQGKKELKILEADSKSIEEQPYISEKSKEHIQEILRKKQHFVQVALIDSSKAMIFGQMLMILGGSLGLGGMGVGALPPLCIGAPITLAAAGVRVVKESKEEKFLGDDGIKYAKDHISNLHVVDLILENYEKENCYKEASKILEDDFKKTVEKLAEVKVLSLIHHAINDKSFKNKSPEDKFEKLNKSFKISDKTGKKKIKGSGLEDSVIKKAHKFVKEKEEEIRELLKIDQEKANKILACHIGYLLSPDCIDLNDQCLSERPSGDFYKVFLQLKLEHKIDDIEEINKKDSRKIINSARKCLKAIRDHDVKGLSALVQIEEVSKKIKERLASGIEYDIEDFKYDLKESNKDKSYVRGFSKKNLARQIANEEKLFKQENDDYKNINLFQYKDTIHDTENGKTLYVYSDPSDISQSDSTKDITYIQDNKTKKIEVVYGKNATGSVLSKANKRTNTGSCLISRESVDEGFKYYGDQYNSKVKVAKEIEIEGKRGEPTLAIKYEPKRDGFVDRVRANNPARKFGSWRNNIINERREFQQITPAA